jgi:hypothetical protein
MMSQKKKNKNYEILYKDRKEARFEKIKKDKEKRIRDLKRNNKNIY